MTTWIWSDPRWRERTGDDPQLLLAEAMRRAIDVREAVGAVGSRGTLLVAVLNDLVAVLGYDLGDLWKGFDNYKE